MKISHSWLQEYFKDTLPTAEALAELFTFHSFEIEGIEGGTVHRLSKGDVITIPAKTPHWWKDTSKTGSVGYYAVNIEQD